MLTRLTLTTLASSLLLTVTACDKKESLGEVGETENASASDTSNMSGSETGDVSCPTDAMICPDGTAVGREGPNCEFAPCPGSTSGNDTDSGTLSGGSETGEVTDSGETDGGETDGETACPPNAAYYYPAACPSENTAPIEEGCYEVCEIDGGLDACGKGETCQVVEVNPCVCDPGEDCCAACAADTTACMPVLRGEACQGLAGAWQSVDELECGITPDGVVMCNWQLDLQSTGEFNWMYSDLGEGGLYHCIEGTIYAQNVNGSYDAQSDLVQWDGVTYERVK